MLFNLFLAALILYSIHRARTYLLLKEYEKVGSSTFDGELYQISNTYVSRRRSSGSKKPKKTIICFPGFLENMEYFIDLYQEKDVELILINNADYQNPFSLNTVIRPEWYQPDRSNIANYELGTIAHDAEIVNLVIENLAASSNILMHGHSRGGAVVIEAAKLNPKKFKKIHALLEAPVLPQAKVGGPVENIMLYGGFYVFPFIVPVWRRLPENILSKHPLMKIYTPRKAELFSKLMTNPIHASTAITNMRNLSDWQKISTYDLFDNFKSLTIMVGEKDGVLSRWHMMKSAKQASSMNKIETAVINTQGTNHFISLERPDLVHEALDMILSKPTVSKTNTARKTTSTISTAKKAPPSIKPSETN